MQAGCINVVTTLFLFRSKTEWRKICHALEKAATTMYLDIFASFYHNHTLIPPANLHRVMANRARPSFYLLLSLFALFQITSHVWPKHRPRSAVRLTTHLLKRAEPIDVLEPQVRQGVSLQFCSASSKDERTPLTIFICSVKMCGIMTTTARMSRSSAPITLLD